MAKQNAHLLAAMRLDMLMASQGVYPSYQACSFVAPGSGCPLVKDGSASEVSFGRLSADEGA